MKSRRSQLRLGLCVASLLTFCSCIHRPLSFAPPADGPDHVIQLPARLAGPLLVVTTTIGGEGPFDFWLDTGASISVLSTEVFTQLKAAGALADLRDGKVTSSTGDRHRYDFVRLEHVRLGEYDVPQATAFVHDLKLIRLALGQNFGGVLGMELFRNCELRVDLANGSLSVAPTNHPPPAGSLTMPCGFGGFTPTVSVVVGLRSVTMAIDTGANGAFALPESPDRRLLVKEPLVVGHLASATQIRDAWAARLKTDIDFGGLRFETPTISIAHVGGGQIGTEVLRHFTFGLNQTLHQAWFLPHGDRSPVPSSPVKSLGFTMVPDGNALRVTHVLVGSDAARAGLQPGDRVSAINHVAFTAWSMLALSDLAKNAESFEIDVSRGKETRALKLRVFTAVE